MDSDRELQQVSIRALRKEDIPAVYSINRENFTTDAWTIQGFERELSLDHSKSYVIEANDQVVGYAVVWIVGDEAHIMTFAVKKALWGKGLGKLLLSRVIEEISPIVNRVLLDVRVSNMRAINLYKSAGFEIKSVRYRYYSDGENAYQMCLELSNENKRTET